METDTGQEIVGIGVNMENRKRQYSRMVIEEAFLDALRQKPLEKISIVDICKQANVNRSTFYSNYLDVYDLMDQVSGRFFENLFTKCIAELGEPNPNGKENSIRFIERALSATVEQHELCQLLIGTPHRTAFIQKLLNSLLEWSSKRYAAYSGVDTERFVLENTMMLGGTLVLWQRWIEGGFQESPEMLASIIDEYIAENTKRIWTRK